MDSQTKSVLMSVPSKSTHNGTEFFSGVSDDGGMSFD
jgi:hypothetical protein